MRHRSAVASLASPTFVVLVVSAVAALASGASAQLGPPPVPPQNPPTPAKVVLGKILFWEEQLSSDDSTACGTCHLPELGGVDGRLADRVHPGHDRTFGTADDVHGSPGLVRQDAAGDFARSPLFGLRRQVTARTPGSPLGAAHHAALFWDGRADGRFHDPETGQLLIPSGGALERQAIESILSPVEMAQEGRTWASVRTKLQHATPLRLATNLPADVHAALQASPTYPQLFTAAFGDPAITGARIAFALASYERTLQPDQTPWDAHQRGVPGALTAYQLAGWNLFQGAGRCTTCHVPPFFADDAFHGLGLRSATEDRGRGAVTASPAELGAFKTPSLRSAGLRPRLFHNGQSVPLIDLQAWTQPGSALMVHWRGGGADRSHVSPLLVPLDRHGVSQADVALMLHFVRTALVDPRAALRLPPFDRPDLRGLEHPTPRQFGPALAGASEPFLVDWVPTWPGNAAFKLGLAGGDGPALAALALGFQSYEPPVVAQGVPWNVVPLTWLFFSLQGSAGAPGIATWHVPLPADPSLALLPIYYQLFVQDPQAPGGLAASRGTEFFIR